MEYDWRSLKPGDKVRFVRIPSVFDEPHYHNGDWEETFELYRRLIFEGETHSIAFFDESGRPWIDYKCVDEHGVEVSHSLAIDDDSWELVSSVRQL